MNSKLIACFRNYRKGKYIGMSGGGQYAFVGIGNHSIHNLYPVVNYLRVNLKYIVTQSESNALLVDRNFPDTIGTSDLQRVLDDEQIKGIFVCANPSSHFELVKRILLANKNVFVEKPPCLSSIELEELIICEKKSGGQCFVGLQKHYAPLNMELKRSVRGSVSYNYRFLTGAYPEGNPLPDLFIHPLSLVTHLFGNAHPDHIAVRAGKAGMTVFLHLHHVNGADGILELSTDYSWIDAKDVLVVNDPSGVSEIINSESMTFTRKPGTFFSIPEEKVFRGRHIAQTIIKRNNFLPVFESNQLYTNGYYGEIDNFVSMCEGKNYRNNASLNDCRNVYELLTKIREKIKCIK